MLVGNCRFFYHRIRLASKSSSSSTKGSIMFCRKNSTWYRFPCPLTDCQLADLLLWINILPWGVVPVTVHNKDVIQFKTTGRTSSQCEIFNSLAFAQVFHFLFYLAIFSKILGFGPTSCNIL